MCSSRPTSNPPGLYDASDFTFEFTIGQLLSGEVKLSMATLLKGQFPTRAIYPESDWSGGDGNLRPSRIVVLAAPPEVINESVTLTYYVTHSLAHLADVPLGRPAWFNAPCSLEALAVPIASDAASASTEATISCNLAAFQAHLHQLPAAEVEDHSRGK
ncbi:hypothetical protein BCR35DRAFT_330056 [Leucosporidium creatinivorum]|uniref:Uncharacterized protein n=1 Tax=Leucosporidium creatinivorum TaxID=106004 RepID=A0A1Y2FVZ7_9BASI|nr:hypothetical protein BCR35DRAFT_330056 [Leucosporidium creatinivorum]